MKIEYYEKVFLWLSALVLMAGLGAIAASVFAAEIHLPGKAGRVDPRTVRETPPFDQPGVFDRGNGEIEVVMLAQTWLYAPSEVRVPAGSKVTFRVTSPDVIHGFLIENTDINAMIVPGQITEVTYTFDKPGEHLIICHEYCGIGHHGMYGRVVVE
jgi:cytochrome c oxidase subunit 2